MAKEKGGKAVEFGADFAPMTDDEIEKIRERARSAVELEVRKAKEKKLYEQFLREAKVDAGMLPASVARPDSAIVIDLPIYAASIVLNGRQYHHGFKYTVSYGVKQTLMEMMHRGHGHQREIEGKSRFENLQKPKNFGISPRGFRPMAA